tara:strand:- start:636 stop:806 length:171 start_codon:yes stop_codon:yes gene_type:complete
MRQTTEIRKIPSEKMAKRMDWVNYNKVLLFFLLEELVQTSKGEGTKENLCLGFRGG